MAADILKKFWNDSWWLFWAFLIAQNLFWSSFFDNLTGVSFIGVPFGIATGLWAIVHLDMGAHQ